MPAMSALGHWRTFRAAGGACLRSQIFETLVLLELGGLRERLGRVDDEHYERL